MLKKLMLILLISLSILNADFKEVNEIELQKMIKNGVLVIDIRRDEEHKALGLINSSTALTFFKKDGSYNVPEWMNEFVKLVKTKDQSFVLVCAHANRTKVVGNFLSKQMKYKNVYDLKGGIVHGWIDKGLKTVKFK